ncbi:MAG TPA: phage tail protein [Pyrinomonadaceae bacterium]|jgi:phage tail-like protein|nr:phage tail protein [Pyrinomonadaceae bacterium]
MAVHRDTPYGAFNFRLTADRFGDAGTIRAGFQEISGLGIEATVAEYRNGNDPENHVRKINGVYKVTDVTLKRGLIGDADFFGWLKDVRDGVQTNVLATVTIELMAEDHSGPVMSWKLTNARPIKYTGPTLNAKGGTDVAMEELVLACESISIE